MAPKGSKMSVSFVFMAMMWTFTLAQPSCQPPLVTLQLCLGFITSNSSAPSPQCCAQLAGLVQTQAQCLCSFLNAAPQLPFNINRTQAITLPGACNIQAPPLSQCNAPAGPFVPAAPSIPFVPAAPSGPFVPAVGPPQESPAPSSPATPTEATAPSPTSSETPSAPSGVSPPSSATPSTKGVPTSKGGSKEGPNKGQQSSSAGSSIKFPPLFFFFLAASALSSF